MLDRQWHCVDSQDGMAANYIINKGPRCILPCRIRSGLVLESETRCDATWLLLVSANKLRQKSETAMSVLTVVTLPRSMTSNYCTAALALDSIEPDINNCALRFAPSQPPGPPRTALVAPLRHVSGPEMPGPLLMYYLPYG